MRHSLDDHASLTDMPPVILTSDDIQRKQSQMQQGQIDLAKKKQSELDLKALEKQQEFLRS